jgi:hypothetical protein
MGQEIWPDLGWSDSALDAFAPLELTELVGVGNDRECWRHPRDRSLCIKVARSEQERAQNEIDFEYSQFLAQHNISGPHITRMYGWVWTDRGPGLVFDLVCEPDDKPSPTLIKALRDRRIAPAQAVALVNEAFDWLVENRVILADYGTRNMLVRRRLDGRRELVFVDGLGARTLDFKYWVRCTFRFKARRKAEEFRRKTLALVDKESRFRQPPFQERHHLAA